MRGRMFPSVARLSQTDASRALLVRSWRSSSSFSSGVRVRSHPQYSMILSVIPGISWPSALPPVAGWSAAIFFVSVMIAHKSRSASFAGLLSSHAAQSTSKVSCSVRPFRNKTPNRP